jgi:hypothetical protein
VQRPLGDQALAQRVVVEQALDHRRERRGSREPKRRPTSAFDTTSRSPPASATMHGQPLAIASSATRPNEG